MGVFGLATGGNLRLAQILGVPVRAGAGPISARQLETLLTHAEDVTLKSKRLVVGRVEADLTASLHPRSWSVAQCLDHLALTTNAFVPAISSAIARAPRLASDRALKTGALTRLFLGNLEPPYRLRFKVLAPLVPHQRDFQSAWDAFEDSQAQLAKTIGSASGLSIDQVGVESPVYARFSYNAYGALRMLIAHERRHLWQIEQILQALSDSQTRRASLLHNV